jgi:hypothetical protein
MLSIFIVLLALLAANINALPAAEPKVYEFNGMVAYELPSDADLSHPAFDIEALIALREKDPTAPLPQVPGLPDLSTSTDHSTSKRTVISLPPPIFECNTNDLSPPVNQILVNAMSLAKIGETWCCMTDKPCSTVAKFGVAASNICNYNGIMWCILCKHVATMTLEVAVLCNKGGYASGKKEYVSQFLFFLSFFFFFGRGCVLIWEQVG